MSVSGINVISINWSEPISSILNMITELIKMKNLKTEKDILISKEESILDKGLKRINVMHTVLSRQIFYPLYQTIVSIYTSINVNPPYIKFTASRVHDSLHYWDEMEHLKQFIPNFLTRFNEIENKVNMYNKDLCEYHNNRKNNYISTYIEANGFNVIYDSNADTPANTINLSNLLPALDRYWSMEIEDIVVPRHENSLDIHNGMGNAQIYLISNDDEERRVRNLIDELKEIDEIKMELDKFYQAIINTYKNAEELSKDIGKNIIRFIELEQYDDKCKLCKV